jgi:hypothetical protein
VTSKYSFQTVESPEGDGDMYLVFGEFVDIVNARQSETLLAIVYDVEIAKWLTEKFKEGGWPGEPNESKD